MGPLGFALGLEHALDQCAGHEDRLAWVSWYLDDGTILGPIEGVAAYLQALCPALATVGLEVNLRKCTRGDLANRHLGIQPRRWIYPPSSR